MGAALVVLVGVVWFGALITMLFRTEGRLRQQGYDRRHKPPRRRPSHLFDPTRSVTLRGGGRVGRTNAAWPFATLTIDDAWAHLGGVFDIWIQREEVTQVRCVRALFSWGVHFDTATGDFDGVLYRTFSVGELLGAFARFGWPTAALTASGADAPSVLSTRAPVSHDQRFPKRPITAAGAVGLLALAVLATLWFTPIHAGDANCGSLVRSLGTFTNHSIGGPCQDARSIRFALGMVTAAIGAPLTLVIFFVSGGRALLGRSR